jgi:hypothetical protein
VLRYTSSGALDPSWGSGGIVKTNGGPGSDDFTGELIDSPSTGAVYLAGYCGCGSAGTVAIAKYGAEPPDTQPPAVVGLADRVANANGWYNANVLIDWQASDPPPSSGAPSDPPDTTADQEGTNAYTSAPSCDPSNNCATGSLTLSIDETEPVVGVPALTLNPKAISETSAVSASASDATSGVVAGEWFVDVDPGEGNGVAMALSGGTLTTTIGTTLATGVYRLCVRAQDAADNWSESSCTFLVVYDASGGFATGGGWLVPGGGTSDPGDLLPGLDGTSKANFGFVVKYQSGASTVPGGQLEFHYNVGAFHVHSAGMEWLVVTNTNWAKFQGAAEIDGAAGLFPFRVDARDGDGAGQSDRFVIKIWAPGANPDTDEPVYKGSGDVSGQVKIHH